MELINEDVRAGTQEVSVRRRRVGKVAVLVAAVPAMVVSGWGMWTFFADILHATAADRRIELILPMFLLFDLAAIACAINARINRIAHARMGVEGWLVWGFAITSGLMSSTEGADWKEKALRSAAPIVAAVLFELLIRGERKDATGELGVVEILVRRAKARFGVLQLDQTEEEIAKAAAAGRLATLAYRLHQTKEGSRARRAALRRYHRKLRSAAERYGFANDEEMILAVRAHLAAMYQSVEGTSAEAVRDINLWRAADREAYGRADREVTGREVQEVTGRASRFPLAGREDEHPALPGSPVTVDPSGTIGLPGPGGDDPSVEAAKSNGKRSDEEILAAFGKQLVAEARASEDGKIAPYRVRTLCSVGAGRADKLAGQINELAATPEEGSNP